MITVTAQADALAHSKAAAAHEADVASEYRPARFFISPAPREIAVRDELANISMLDERDATQVIVGQIDEVRARLGKSETPTAIAYHLHLACIIGLNPVEEAAAFEYLTNNSTGSFGLRDDMRAFGWLEFERLRDSRAINVPARVVI